MKSILLVTLQSDNFGNRLQNYALQHQLEKMNCSVYNIVNTNPNNYNFYVRIKLRIKTILGFLGVKKYYDNKVEYIRHKSFDKFNRLHIHQRLYTDTYSNISIKQKIDVGIVGSDQVWHNWSKTKEELNYYYLTFLEKNKRVAYAGSFGFEGENIPDVNMHSNLLREMRTVSCREKTGCDIVYSLTNKYPTLVLDPTLLITQNEWLQLEKEPKRKPSGGFVLIYMLGDKTDRFSLCLNKVLMENKDLLIIDILDKSGEWYYSDPQEFIWMVNNASYVITDSFHAVVFSLIFHKDFFVLRKFYSGVEDKMFDRIDTLLDQVEAKTCIFDEGSRLKSYDFNKFDIKIRSLQSKSLEYLNEIINMEIDK